MTIIAGTPFRSPHVHLLFNGRFAPSSGHPMAAHGRRGAVLSGHLLDGVDESEGRGAEGRCGRAGNDAT